MAKAKMNADPVIADQAGRLMPVDPLGINAPREELVKRRACEVKELVKRRAYEIYESRGREDGHELEHWFEAESELER